MDNIKLIINQVQPGNRQLAYKNLEITQSDFVYNNKYLNIRSESKSQNMYGHDQEDTSMSFDNDSKQPPKTINPYDQQKSDLGNSQEFTQSLKSASNAECPIRKLN